MLTAFEEVVLVAVPSVVLILAILAFIVGQGLYARVRFYGDCIVAEWDYGKWRASNWLQGLGGIGIFASTCGFGVLWEAMAGNLAFWLALLVTPGIFVGIALLTGIIGGIVIACRRY